MEPNKLRLNLHGERNAQPYSGEHLKMKGKLQGKQIPSDTKAGCEVRAAAGQAREWDAIRSPQTEETQLL